MYEAHALQGHPKWMGESEEFWQNVVHWRREWQITSVFLSQEPHEQYKGAKDMISKDKPPRSEGSNMLSRKGGGQLLIAPERMKLLGWSGNDAHLWMCLVVKVKSDVIKNNTAQEPGI